MLGDRLPALVPDAPGAQHLVVLGLLGGGGVGGVEAVAHRHPGQRGLPVAVDDLGHLHAAAVEDRRDDVGAVVVLAADLAPGLDAGRPVDHQRVAHAALVAVALEHPVRGREAHRPAGRVVVVGRRGPQLVEHGQVVLDRVRVGVEELVLVDRAVGAALARGAVVGGVEDQGVVELARLLQVVDDPADLGVGVLREAGEHLGHAGEQPLLLVRQRVPGPDRVALAEGARRHRVDRGQLGALGQDPPLDHPRQDPLAVGLVAVVELAPVLVDVLLGGVVGGVVGARAEPQVPGLVRLRLLGVADELQRLVGQVLGEVVAVLGPVRLLDVVVVLGQVRIPLVGLAADEPVEAVVAQPERPVLLGRAHRPGVDRRVVVLADPERAPAGLAQHGRHRGVLARDVGVVAGEPGRGLGDRREPVLMVVAPGQEHRAGRRAQRRGVPLGVGEAVVGQPLHRRHLDPSAVRRPGRAAGVVIEHHQHVRRTLGRPVGQERRPVGGRVPDVELDLALELLGHGSSLTRAGRRAQHPMDEGEWASPRSG